MNERELLTDTTPFMPPGRILEGLSSADAERPAPGAPHSIAEIVAHMVFWQEWFARRAQGAREPMPPHADQGWPEVAPATWDSLRERYLAHLERLVAMGAERRGALEPPLEYPPLAHYTVADVFTHVAMHNAHHLGQVVLLRQQMGLWPPPAGSYTW